MVTERVSSRYRAVDDLAERWPGWRVLRTPDLAPGSEEVFREIKLAVVGDSGDREWSVAHVVAHLDLEHQGEVFTRQQEVDADYLAGVRLDVEWEDVPMDGPPSVPLR